MQYISFISVKDKSKGEKKIVYQLSLINLLKPSFRIRYIVVFKKCRTQIGNNVFLIETPYF